MANYTTLFSFTCWVVHTYTRSIFTLNTFLFLRTPSFQQAPSGNGTPLPQWPLTVNSPQKEVLMFFINCPKRTEILSKAPVLCSMLTAYFVVPSSQVHAVTFLLGKVSSPQTVNDDSRHMFSLTDSGDKGLATSLELRTLFYCLVKTQWPKRSFLRPNDYFAITVSSWLDMESWLSA